MSAEVSRFALDQQASLDRALFSSLITAAGFSLRDFPLLDSAYSDPAFVDNLELLVTSLANIAWLVETFGGSEESLAQSMLEFFALPLLPAGLPRPSPLSP